MNDYDPYLVEQIYDEIKTSDKSRRETMSQVRGIMGLASRRIIDNFRPDVSTSNITSNDFLDETFAYVTSDVNMRSGPSTENKIITVLHTGNRVEIIHDNTNTQHWLKIKYGQYVGYVNVAYLKRASNK